MFSFSLSSIGRHSVPSVWDSLQPDGPANSPPGVASTAKSFLTLPPSPHLSSWTEHLCPLGWPPLPFLVLRRPAPRFFSLCQLLPWKPWRLIAKVLEVQLLPYTLISVFTWQHNLLLSKEPRCWLFKLHVKQLVHTSVFSRELLKCGHLLLCLGNLAQSMTHGRSSVNRCWISVYFSHTTVSSLKSRFVSESLDTLSNVFFF